METNKKTQRLFTGEVVSDKMDKTVVVKTVRTFKHPIFGKVLKKEKHYKVHDEKEEARPGDIIEFFEGRPVAKTKYMYFSRVVTRSQV